MKKLIALFVLTMSFAASATTVPAMDMVTLDGGLDEWTAHDPVGAWLPNNVVHGRTNFSGPKDLGGQCWLGWDHQFLYVAAEVIDDTHSQTEVAEQMYRGDHVMLLLDADREQDRSKLEYDADDFQIGLSPGSLSDRGDFLTRRSPEAVVWLPLYVQTPGIVVAAKKTERGYTLEAAIPWSFLGVTPRMGQIIGFDVNPSDNDSPEAVQQSLASLIEGKWALGKTDRMLEGELIGTPPGAAGETPNLPAATELARDEFQLPPGAEKTFQVIRPDGAGEAAPLLQFDARWAADRLAGASYGLQLEVNGKPVDFDRVVNRPAQVTFARGDAQPLSTVAGWTLFYSPDYEAIHKETDSGYFIPPGKFNAYRFTVNLNDLLHPGENTVTLRYLASSIKDNMALREVRLSWASEAQVNSMRTGNAAGLRRTEVQVSPPAPLVPPGRAAVTKTGAITFDANGRKWLIESNFSEPGGKWLSLNAKGDVAWKKPSRPDAHTFTAATDRLRLTRKLVLLKEGIEIRDTLANLTNELQPVMVRHTMNWPAAEVGKLVLNGRELPMKRGISSNNQNPTILVDHADGSGGIALTPVDDVFRVHHQAFLIEDKLGLADNNLVLSPGATYEQVWQVYAVPSGDYWDMVNAIRRSWETNFRIDGGFAIVDIRNDWEQHTFTPEQWKDWIEKRSAKFLSLMMYHPFTGQAIHGLQFDQYEPEANAFLKQSVANMQASGADVDVLHYFHCFLTGSTAADKADPKDRMLDSSGNQVHYGGDPIWPLFVPTETNTFGRQMEAQLKRMFTDFGVDGIYWDEHEYSYQDYHYGEPWDGVSGIIDSDSHELVRKRTHMTLISLPLRQKLIGWLVENNHPLICNGAPATYSGTQWKVPRFTETGSVTNLYNMHLYTPIGLADHTTERSHLDTVGQQMQFLDHGSLYYYYTARMPVENPGLVKWMYPITPIALGPGYILGEERILTTRPGRFSWGDAKLPAFEVHVIGPTGEEVAADYKTVGLDGKEWVELRLRDNQAAAIVRTGQPNEKARAIDSPALEGDGFSVQVSPGGGLQIDANGDCWVIDSSFSYPGQHAIAFNRLKVEGPAEWVKSCEETDDGKLRLVADSEPYSLYRELSVRNGRIEIRDTLTSKAAEDIGILVDHQARAFLGLTDAPLLCGMGESTGNSAANPTVYLRQSRSGLGIVVEDNVFRIQFESARVSDGASIGLKQMALQPGKSITLEWAIYPLGDVQADYFTFINRVRNDWDVNYTIPGPSDMFNITRSPHVETLADPEKLRAYLQRNRLKVMSLAPWLDYDNMNVQTNRLTTREEYKQMMREARQRVHAVDPEVLIVGDIEAPFVSLPEDVVQALYVVKPADVKQGYHEMTDEMLEEFQRHPAAWKRWGDSIVWSKDNRAMYELYYRSEKPLIALTVRPVVGNGQDLFLLDQARFILEDVGLDGIYVDSFSGAKHWHYGYSFDRWDGLTVDIDPDTGKIARKYTDLALAGTASRKALVEYGLAKGKIVITNDFPITRDEQPLRAMRFNESEWGFEPLKWFAGEKPHLDKYACEGQLSTPIALGFRPDRYGQAGLDNYSKVIIQGAIAYLRHGILYFHYGTEIPDTGDGAGEYGPFNEMFPITPVVIGEGFVEGKERIVTCVSRTFVWPDETEPRVQLFDIHGREAKHSIKPTRTTAGWTVDVHLEDWQNIAVIDGGGQ